MGVTFDAAAVVGVLADPCMDRAAEVQAGRLDTLAAEEDVHLVRAAAALGYRVDGTARAPVITSARTVSRTTGGFAIDVRERILPPVVS